MSSTPGWLSSIDDFYINGQDLVVIETTNGLNNPDLYKLITPTGERTAALCPDETRHHSSCRLTRGRCCWLYLSRRPDTTQLPADAEGRCCWQAG